MTPSYTSVRAQFHPKWKDSKVFRPDPYLCKIKHCH